MAKCTRIRKKNRKVCVGDMKDRVILQNRALQSPLFGNVDFDETFTNVNTVWAAVNTVSGKTFFDGVNTEINITHEVYIYFDASVTAQTWVEYNSHRLDILAVENLDERGEFMKLTCVDKGLTSKEASKT